MTAGQLDYLVLGAGAAGLQTAYFLDRAGRSYLVLEASGQVGGFWRRLPRSRRLISFDKVPSLVDDPEADLRWDWNSLLTENHASLFRDVSRRLFPTGDEMADYLSRFAEQHRLRIALHSPVARVERARDGSFLVEVRGGPIRRARALIVATGRTTANRFDDAIFAPACRPRLTSDDRFPALTESWESVDVPGLFFTGTATEGHDFQNTSSAFVSGFRYNIRTLARLLDERYAGVPLPVSRLAFDPAAVAFAVLDRTRRTSALWPQFGSLCDALVLDEETGELLAFLELPFEYVKAGRLGDHALVYTVTIEWGPLDRDFFDQQVSLHPVIRAIAAGEIVAEHHVPEDLYDIDGHDHEPHVEALTAFLEQSMSNERPRELRPEIAIPDRLER